MQVNLKILTGVIALPILAMAGVAYADTAKVATPAPQAKVQAQASTIDAKDTAEPKGQELNDATETKSAANSDNVQSGAQGDQTGDHQDIGHGPEVAGQ